MRFLPIILFLSKQTQLDIPIIIFNHSKVTTMEIHKRHFDHLAHIGKVFQGLQTINLTKSHTEYGSNTCILN